MFRKEEDPRSAFNPSLVRDDNNAQYAILDTQYRCSRATMSSHMKTIVTHHNPDLDGIPAAWLLKKFHPDFADAKLVFVPAGTNLHDAAPDYDQNTVHVDTGFGKFDHHQTNDYTCGAKLVFDYLKAEGYIPQSDEAMTRLVDVLVAIDHGKENEWPDAESDVYDFHLLGILNGWKMLHPNDELLYTEWVMNCLEGVYRMFQSKVDAEKEFAKGTEFTTQWGKGMAITTYNDGVLELGIKRGYAMVLRKDPKREFIRVTGDSNKSVDLIKAYETCKQKDPMASWFLHASKVLLRNGSTKNPKMVPTKLTLQEMIDILEKA